MVTAIIPNESTAEYRSNRLAKGSLSSQTTPDRRPPHSTEAEQGVLGCILLSPVDCLDHCISKFPSSEVFYDLRHRVIFDVLIEMHQKLQAIDLITLQQTLKDKQQLEVVGGLAYLSALPDCVPSAANLDYYLNIAMEKFTLRKMIGTCTEVASRAYEHQGEVEKLLDEVERDILSLCKPVEVASTRKDSFLRITDRIEQAFLNPGKLAGLESGLYPVDKIVGGWRDGTMNVIAARPGLGKSTMGWGIAEHNAKQGIPVGYFSLEMSEDELNLRCLCSNAGINSKHALLGSLTERDMTKLVANVGPLGKLPIYVCDRSDMNIIRIRSEARRMVSKLKVKLIVLDYLQLVIGSSRFGRREDVDEISRGIKGMSKELGIPVIALAQLNREIERDAGRRPRLSDLRESGGIEQDADTVSFIYCPDDTQIHDDGTLPVKWSTQKNRNGELAECDLLLERALTRFRVPSLMGAQ